MTDAEELANLGREKFGTAGEVRKDPLKVPPLPVYEPVKAMDFIRRAVEAIGDEKSTVPTSLLEEALHQIGLMEQTIRHRDKEISDLLWDRDETRRAARDLFW